jgi:hypothetical protein
MNQEYLDKVVDKHRMIYDAILPHLIDSLSKNPEQTLIKRFKVDRFPPGMGVENTIRPYYDALENLMLDACREYTETARENLRLEVAQSLAHVPIPISAIDFAVDTAAKKWDETVFHLAWRIGAVAFFKPELVDNKPSDFSKDELENVIRDYAIQHY